MLQLHPSDNDAGWNSAQHSKWPRALSGEFDPSVNNWWIGLWCYGVSWYWGKPIHKYVVEQRLFKWTSKLVWNVWNNGLMLGGNYFYQASPVDFHPRSRRIIRLWYLTYHDFISHLLKLSRNNGRYRWLKPRQTNIRLLIAIQWLVTFRDPPRWMLGGIPSTAWGVNLYEITKIPDIKNCSAGQARGQSNWYCLFHIYIYIYIYTSPHLLEPALSDNHWTSHCSLHWQKTYSCQSTRYNTSAKMSTYPFLKRASSSVLFQGRTGTIDCLGEFHVWVVWT